MLTGRLALVTGAASGIGYQVAKIFAQQGATLILTDVKNNFDKLLNEIKTNNDKSSTAKKHLTHVCDVSNSQDVKTLFKKIKENYPNQVANIIVNSAGIAVPGEIRSMPESDFDKVININLKGTFLVNQVAIIELLNNHKNVKLAPNQTYASIINLASIMGKYGFPLQVNYVSSKAGLEGLTKTIAREYGRYQIRCNAILPGLIDTPMTEPIDQRRKLLEINATPLGRMGRPEEVAQLCLFLASDSSSYINGACIQCDGGLVL